MEEHAKAAITIETSRWSKIGELLLLSEESHGINANFTEEKCLLRKRIRITMDGPAYKVDRFLRMARTLSA